MKRTVRPNPLFHYVLPLIVVISVTAFVDGILIIPMVEIDPALSILVNRSANLERWRDIGPTLSSVIMMITMMIVYGFYVSTTIARSPESKETRRLVLLAPRFYGLSVALGWGIAFLVSVGIDLGTLTFPVPGEAVAYYVSSAVAMLSTGAFGMIAAWVVIDDVNRRVMIPYIFPRGFVSRDSTVKKVRVPQMLMALWFCVTFFPLLVLSLGFFTRQYLPQNDLRAALFVLIFLPASGLLVFRVGQSTQKPLQDLVNATGQIAKGNFRLSLRSNQNDDVGYLIDATIDMAQSLEEKELISETFGRAVDPRVRDHLLAGNIALGGTRRTAAIMFCDIRGFTTLSEGRPEEDIVALLNEHLAAMDTAVQASGGMINKFLGDGFLALFGAPLDDPQPAHAAFEAALEIVRVNKVLNDRRIARGDPTLGIGVGIHIGPVIAGNIGSPARSEYTVIGDSVNLASRVEGLTKRLGAEIIVTDAIRQAIETEGGGRPELRDLGEHDIRGRSGLIRVWSI